VEGECATVRACQSAGILFGLSQQHAVGIEDAAQAAQELARWYQAYILAIELRTLQLVRRVVKAGYQGIF
jgi:isopentenyl diphosphate isomerase/L-lactate dehydrogenase-like FMN-dependent dehydrogenase